MKNYIGMKKSAKNIAMRKNVVNFQFIFEYILFPTIVLVIDSFLEMKIKFFKIAVFVLKVKGNELINL